MGRLHQEAGLLHGSEEAYGAQNADLMATLHDRASAGDHQVENEALSFSRAGQSVIVESVTNATRLFRVRSGALQDPEGNRLGV